MIRAAIFLIFLLLSLTHLARSRIVAENFNLISDGAADYSSRSPKVELNSTVTTTVTCEPIYGFLPCTTEIWGQLFLIVVYEYLLSLGNQYVAGGSELFFNMIGPGIFGASLFQLLGSIQITIFMLVSGLSASTETAEEQAAMSMGLLAGSAVMLLTLIWGFCIAFGSNDLSKSSPSTDSENEKPFSFTGFGVSTDVETSYTARIMILSVIPFIILQLAKILNSSTGKRITILVSFCVTLAFIFAYCFYQVFQPWIQNRKFEYLMNMYVKNKLLGVLTTNGKPNITFMKELFQEIDKNKNGYITEDELRVLVMGIHIEEEGFKTGDFVEKVIGAFDTSGDARIDEAEFVKGLVKYISDSQQSQSVDNTKPHDRFKFFGSTVKSTNEEQQSLVPQRKASQSQSAKKSWWNYLKAAFLLVLGTAITVILAQPLIEAVSDFATSANISSFYVSYVVIPLALHYRQALSTITSARQKTQNAISLTLSEIYGAVFMNNMTGLAMFLVLIYIRNLSWNVSAEVLVVLIICTVMGIFTSLRTSFPLWTSFVAFLLYPISLLLLYFLTTVCGWS